MTDGRAETATLDLGFELRFVVVLPLVARNRRLGALVLGYADREFDAATRALAEDLAARAAVAIDNCLLYAKVQEADQRKNEFLAMLAHELRNPLAPMRNAAQMLRSSQADAAKLEWAANVIDRQSRHLVRLVDDLLDVARITQGKITLSFEAVDVATVVRHGRGDDAAADRVPQAHAGGPHAARRRCRSTAIAPASRRYSAICSTTPRSIPSPAAISRWKWRRAADEVVFRVRDSGIGIPRELLGSIFDLFIQADRSLDRSQGGLGIGLTIVRNLVHMQGGSVHVASAGAGKGSEFVVRLPRVATSVPSRRSPRSVPRPPLRTRRGCAFSSSTTIRTPRKAWRH